MRLTAGSLNLAAGLGALACAGAVILPRPAAAATFGKTTVGALSDKGMFANYKIVHSAKLSVEGSVSSLSVYAIPGSNSPISQALEAVIYSDSGGSPSTLLATGKEVTYNGSTNGSGWFELPLKAPVTLAPGTYWIGFITGATTEGMGYRYDNVAGSRAYNTNSFTSGPSNPFGAATKDSEQASIYATYTAVTQAKPSTIGLALTPGIKVLRATWGVTGVSGEQRLVGWRLKCRPVTAPVSKWTTVTPDLPAGAREDIFTQLEAHPYEISVLPRYEESGTQKSGVAQTAVATPLKDEPGLDLGKVRFRAETAKSGTVAGWDDYDLVEWEPWLAKHVPYLKGYPTLPAASSTRWLDIGLPSSTIIQGYWDWDKEETEGGPFAPLNATRRSSFITHRVEGTIAAGYSGIWLDDINWHTTFRDNKQSTAFEPEFTEQLELIRAIRAKIGAGKLLTINSQFVDVEEYLLGLAGTETERKVIREAYAEADLAAKEFGISFLTSATAYRELFEWVAYLHEHGTQVEMLPTVTEESANPGLFRKEHQFNLATYLLFNAQATALKSGRQSLGGDFVGGKEMTPMPRGNTNPSIAGSPEPRSHRFWRGYELDLGTPLAGEAGKYKRESSGLWVRSFSSGIVYALEPGAAAVKLPALPRMMEQVDGTKLAPGSRPELKASEGLVLIG